MAVITPTVSFWVSIHVYGNRLRKCDPLCDTLRWKDMSMEVRRKWQWYFEYRAALLKIAYPKALVEMKWGSEEAKDNTRIHILTKRLIAKKGQYTKARKKLAALEKEYNDNLFASQTMEIGDYLQGYDKAVEKLNRKKSEMEAMEAEIKSLKDSSEKSSTALDTTSTS